MVVVAVGAALGERVCVWVESVVGRSSKGTATSVTSCGLGKIRWRTGLGHLYVMLILLYTRDPRRRVLLGRRQGERTDNKKKYTTTGHKH